MMTTVFELASSLKHANLSTAPQSMGNSNDSLVELWSLCVSALGEYVFLPLITLLSCLLSVFVVLGNLLVVTAIWHENQLHTVTNYLIGSLAAADCLVGALVMPFNIISEIIIGSWTFGPTWCDLWHSFDVLASTASIMNLCAISLDRYLAITNPISYPTKMTPKRVAFLIVSIWTCSSLISFPAIIWWRAVGQGPLQEIHSKAPARHRNSSTSSNSSPLFVEAQVDLAELMSSGSSQEVSTSLEYKCVFTDDTYYLLFSSFISFYGPLCVMLYAYYCIYRAAVQQTRFLKYGSKQVMVSGGSGTSKSGSNTSHGNKRTRYTSELDMASDRLGSSERDNEGQIANSNSNNGHDKQRLVLRVHRGGGGGSINKSALSNKPSGELILAGSQRRKHGVNATIKLNCDTTSDATKAFNQSAKGSGSEQANCLANGRPPSIGSNQSLVGNSATNHRRGPISKRDELRVKSQRFDSSSTCSAPADLPQPPLGQVGGSSLSQPPSAITDSNQPARSLGERRPMLTSDTSTDASIVTVEPREVSIGANTNCGQPALVSDGQHGKPVFRAKKSKSCRNIADQTTTRPNSTSSDETDELLSKTRAKNYLSKFKRTISLESALELRRQKRKSGRQTVNQLSGSNCDQVELRSCSEHRQPALAYQDSDKFIIRNMIDLSAIHYIDCAKHQAPTYSSTTAVGSSNFQKPTSTSVIKCASLNAGPARATLAPGQLLAKPTVVKLTPSSASASSTTTSTSAGPETNHKSQHQNHPAPVQQQQTQNGSKKLTKLAKERKAAKTLGIVVGVFILCWLPFFVVNIIVATCGIGCIFKPNILISIVTWLGWLNSAMNPVIYACWSRDFRRAFRKTLCTWVEFVCYDGTNMARRLRLKKGSSYLNAQETFLSKSAAGSLKRSATNALNSNLNAVSISIETRGPPSSDV